MIELYPFQKEVLEKTSGKKRVGYFLDMGLGKTFVGTEKAKEIGNPVNLIICQKSKIDDWIDHCLTNYDKLQPFDLSNKNQYERFFDCDLPKVGVINYDLIFRRKELLSLSGYTLILDESTCIQNLKAKRTKTVLKMNDQVDAVILLSGSVSGGKYENLYTHCKLLGWKIRKSQYDKRYVNWLPLDVGKGMIVRIPNPKRPYKHVEELKQKLREHGAVFMKTNEVIDLPEQNFIEIKVKASSAYNKFIKDDYVVIDGDELMGDGPLTKLLFSRQLCGIYSRSKIKAFKDLLESTNDRVLVFYNYNEELKALLKETNDRPVSIINGTLKDLESYHNEPNSVTFIQYQAGAMGLNLQKANKIIYFTPPLSSELYEQSKKRIHRIGQNKTCFYYNLIVENSIEKTIYATLKKRMDYTDALFRYGGMK